jgi:hypothetical protein
MYSYPETTFMIGGNWAVSLLTLLKTDGSEWKISKDGI